MFTSKYIYVVLAAVIGFLSLQVYFLSSANKSLQKEKGELVTRVESLKGNIELQNKGIEALKKDSEEKQKKLDGIKIANGKIQTELSNRLKQIDDFKFANDCPGKINQFKQKLMEFGHGN